MSVLTKEQCDSIRNRLVPLDNPDLVNLLDTVDALKGHLRWALEAYDTSLITDGELCVCSACEAPQRPILKFKHLPTCTYAAAVEASR